MSTPLQRQAEVQLRYEVVAGDQDRVGQLVAATGKFYPDEVAIAVELVQERLTRGPVSGYEFILAERNVNSSDVPETEIDLVGFACFGPIPCTRAAYDLYWIAVNPVNQHRGIGKKLLALVEEGVVQSGGTHLYADTSGRADYEPTRRYYEANGFTKVAQLDDFYAPGDAKVIYRKAV